MRTGAERLLAKVRAVIHDADPEIVEEWKWRGTPVWSHGGIVCTGETYKEVVKIDLRQRSSVEGPPSGLFNSSLEGNVRRAIDIHEGEKLNEAALRISSARQWRSISRARASRSPGPRKASEPADLLVGVSPVRTQTLNRERQCFPGLAVRVVLRLTRVVENHGFTLSRSVFRPFGKPCPVWIAGLHELQ